MFGGGKTFNPDTDIPSLKDKVVLVTGGNAGLGKESVLQLAKHQPREIFLAARTSSKAEAAIAEIKEAVPDCRLTHLHLDLTSFASIKKAADEFVSRSDRLDILLNNAGIMAMPYSTTQEGYEIQFGTNHLGHALLTKLLLPTLLKTAEEPDADVRVINVSSEGHQLAPGPGIVYDQAELENWSTWRRYGQSKLANIYHARELATRYPTITATSLHPGVIITDLYRHQNFVVRNAMGLAKLVLKDVPAGSKNQLWAATASKDEVRAGYYWKPVGVRGSGNANAQNLDKAAELWRWTEAEFVKHGY